MHMVLDFLWWGDRFASQNLKALNSAGIDTIVNGIVFHLSHFPFCSHPNMPKSLLINPTNLNPTTALHTCAVLLSTMHRHAFRTISNRSLHGLRNGGWMDTSFWCIAKEELVVLPQLLRRISFDTEDALSERHWDACVLCVEQNRMRGFSCN